MSEGRMDKKRDEQPKQDNFDFLTVRRETPGQKLKRKFKENPFVPAGSCLFFG